jgi:glucose/arabinose dehydrogenase
MSLNRSLGTLAVVALASAIPAAQQPAATRPPGVQDGQIIRTAAATLRVSAVRGFVYPWALAFLPNGDMLVTEQGRNTLRLVHNGVLDPTPITGLPQGITSTRRDTAGVEIAVHPRFTENRYIYVAYWKPAPGSEAAKGTNIRTAVLLRARYDGGSTLSDVREIFASASWTDGPSAARLVFSRDGKIYMAIAPWFADERGTRRGPRPRRARRQDPPAERRRQYARGQPVCRTTRIQARDVRARHSQRPRADRSPRDR